MTPQQIAEAEALAEWPREIWMAEREEHDQGVVSAVLSEHATVPLWAGDEKRDREFHRYVDADIMESFEKYHKARMEALLAHVAELEAREARLREALTASPETKADYMGEFSVRLPDFDEDGNETVRNINVPWTTIKEVMAAIRDRAALANKETDDADNG